MAKLKNSSQHNVNAKAFRNGIQRPPRHRYASLKGMCSKFLRNQRWAKKHNKVPKAHRNKAKVAEAVAPAA